MWSVAWFCIIGFSCDSMPEIAQESRNNDNFCSAVDRWDCNDTLWDVYHTNICTHTHTLAHYIQRPDGCCNVNDAVWFE